MPVSTAGMVYHQLFGVGLDAGHDSYMCRIVYVDASGFFSPKCGQLLVFSSSDVPGG